MMQIAGRAWAIRPEVAEEMRQTLATVGVGAVAAERLHSLWKLSRPRASAAAAAHQAPARGGAVAVIPVLGMLLHRSRFLGTSAQGLITALRGAGADQSVSAVVLDVDSPGGEVHGIPEAAAEIRDLRAIKPVVAVANSEAASAAYYLASQADEVLVIPSGQVGSIGIVWMHIDLSKTLDQMGWKVTLVWAGKYKVEGNPLEPLNDEALAAKQATVDRYYEMFVKDVAKGRRVPVERVRSGFGEGRMVGARAAVDFGMADGVGTLEDGMRRAAALSSERARSAAPGALAQAQGMRYRRERA